MKPLKYSDMIRKARKAGFVLRRRTSGTHEIWWREKGGQTCVIPHHREIRAGTLKSILRQMNLSEKEFGEL